MQGSNSNVWMFQCFGEAREAMRDVGMKGEYMRFALISQRDNSIWRVKSHCSIVSNLLSTDWIWDD